jgi:hypothetical protein
MSHRARTGPTGWSGTPLARATAGDRALRSVQFSSVQSPSHGDDGSVVFALVPECTLVKLRFHVNACT